MAAETPIDTEQKRLDGDDGYRSNWLCVIGEMCFRPFVARSLVQCDPMGNQVVV